MATVEFSSYDIHKQLYKKMAMPTEDEIHSKLVSIGAWFSTHPQNDYYMLMCREIYDFTVFHFNNMNYDQGMQEIKTTLNNRGQIIDITYSQENDSYECWIKSKDGEVRMYLLFNCDFMVVEVE